MSVCSKRATAKIRSHAIQYAAHHPEPLKARDAFVAMRDLSDFRQTVELLAAAAV